MKDKTKHYMKAYKAKEQNIFVLKFTKCLSTIASSLSYLFKIQILLAELICFIAMLKHVSRHVSDSHYHSTSLARLIDQSPFLTF